MSPARSRPPISTRPRPGRRGGRARASRVGATREIARTREGECGEEGEREGGRGSGAWCGQVYGVLQSSAVFDTLWRLGRLRRRCLAYGTTNKAPPALPPSLPLYLSPSPPHSPSLAPSLPRSFARSLSPSPPSLPPSLSLALPSFSLSPLSFLCVSILLPPSPSLPYSLSLPPSFPPSLYSPSLPVSVSPPSPSPTSTPSHIPSPSPFLLAPSPSPSPSP